MVRPDPSVTQQIVVNKDAMTPVPSAASVPYGSTNADLYRRHQILQDQYAVCQAKQGVLIETVQLVQAALSRR